MKVSIISIAIVGLIVGLVMFAGCSSLGTRPSDNDKQRFESSKQFNKDKKIFENRQRHIYEVMSEDRNMLSMAWKFFTFSSKPSEDMPQIKPDMDKFLEASEDVKVIWFGHSSLLLNMEGKIILLDPVLSAHASPVFFITRRFQDPVLELEDLPEIDYIVFSHDHYDHLDVNTVNFFKEKNTKFIMPIGVGGHLRGWNVPEERIIERDWWENIVVDGLEFIATPAQHFSGRKGIDQNETLWASWVIKSANNSVYFSGDSGYDTHFKEIGDKYGPFDVAFIESGQYNEMWSAIHLLPKYQAHAFRDLQTNVYFPIHWGMFQLALHEWYEPIEALYKKHQSGQINLVTPKLGEIIVIDGDYKIDPWWKPYMDKDEALEKVNTEVVENVKSSK